MFRQVPRMLTKGRRLAYEVVETISARIARGGHDSRSIPHADQRGARDDLPTIRYTTVLISSGAFTPPIVPGAVE